MPVHGTGWTPSKLERPYFESSRSSRAPGGVRARACQPPLRVAALELSQSRESSRWCEHPAESLASRSLLLPPSSSSSHAPFP
eukprot:282750-Rhodomonas_salina.1